MWDDESPERETARIVFYAYLNWWNEKYSDRFKITRLDYDAARYVQNFSMFPGVDPSTWPVWPIAAHGLRDCWIHYDRIGAYTKINYPWHVPVTAKMGHSHVCEPLNFNQCPICKPPNNTYNF